MPHKAPGPVGLAPAFGALPVAVTDDTLEGPLNPIAADGWL